MVSEEPKLTILSFHQCSNLVSIKLSTTNFLLWKSQILPLIRGLKLEHHITSSEKPVDEVTDSTGNKSNNPDKDQWVFNDGLLTSWLLSNMKEETLSLIYGGDTAFSIWSAINEQLLPDSEDNEAQLKNNLYGLSKGTLSLEEYIRKFKDICDKLAAIGKPLSDVDKVFQISKGLGNKYKEFKIAVLSKPPYPTFNQFIMSLQNFEQVYLAEEKSSVDHNQAFFSLRGKANNMRGGRGNFRGRGSQNYTQGRLNRSHSFQASNSRFPPNANSNWKAPPRQQNKEACQICGRTNHIATKCHYRYEYTNVEENAQEALASLYLNDDNDQNFYVDSGATTHMTNQGGNLQNLKPYLGTDKVFVGNGQALPITHKGQIFLKTTQGNLNLNNILVVPNLKKNLLSVSQLTNDNDCIFEFNSDGFVIKDRKQRILAEGHKQGNLYALKGGNFEALSTFTEASSEIWHARLGHPNLKFLQTLENKQVINVSNWLTKKYFMY
jgi:hypothetical protein